MLTARGRSKAMPMIKMPGFGATPPVCLWAFFATEIEHPCLCTPKSSDCEIELVLTWGKQALNVYGFWGDFATLA